VDLLAITPTFLSLLVPGSQYLLVMRVLRLLRIFRIFKLSEHLSEAEVHYLLPSSTLVFRLDYSGATPPPRHF
jgi:hypothetical protein